MAAAAHACRAPGEDVTGVRVGGSIGLTAEQGPSPHAMPPGDGAGGAQPDAGGIDPAIDPSGDPAAPAVPPGGVPAPAAGADVAGTTDPAGPGTPAGEGDDPTAPTAPPPAARPPTPVDLAVHDVRVPATAEPTADGCGDPLTFGADHLVDGDEATAWRMAGDGTGESITLTLEGPRRVLSVGLVPGFDQVDPCDGTDRFAANRRVVEVTWEFDDGQRVRQRLADLASLQRIDVDATTRTIVLHIDGVSADPERDFTPVAEVALRGV